jgi:hypothetical protein
MEQNKRVHQVEEGGNQAGACPTEDTWARLNYASTQQAARQQHQHPKGNRNNKQVWSVRFRKKIFVQVNRQSAAAITAPQETCLILLLLLPPKKKG